MDRDADHLKLLGLFSYLYGGLQACFGLFPLVYVFMGGVMVTGGFGPTPTSSSSSSGPPPEAMGWFFIALGIVVTLIIEAGAVANLFAGRSIRRADNRLFCLVVAGFNCLNFPLGIVLGVCTFVVLLRPTVEQRFREGRGVA